MVIGMFINVIEDDEKDLQYQDAFSNPNWQAMIQEQYHSILANQTWTLEDLALPNAPSHLVGCTRKN